MKKKISVLFLCFVLLLACFPNFAFAESNMELNKQSYWKVMTNNQGEIYLYNTVTGEKMVQAYRIDENNNIVYLDLEALAGHLNAMEYAKRLNLVEDIPLPKSPASQKDNDVVPQYTTLLPWREYRETRSYTKLGTPEKVTPDYVGPYTITHATSITVTESFGGSVSISGAVKDAIKAGASFTWSRSAQSSTTIGGNTTVPEGKIGYVQFTPYLNVSEGDVYYCVASSTGKITKIYEGTAWGSCPKKLSNGMADGIYQLILR